MYLYLDTSENITVGLLNDQFNWIEVFSQEVQKSSELLHKKVHEMLNQNNLELDDLKAVVSSAGPGSYTGIRLSQGISDILKWQNFDHFSFYNFEIPKIAGIESGIWIANAFKGEIFVYNWDGDNISDKLITLEEFLETYKDYPGPVFSHYKIKDVMESKETSELLRNESERIFSSIISGGSSSKDPYYFRPLEKEFKPSK